MNVRWGLVAVCVAVLPNGTVAQTQLEGPEAAVGRYVSAWNAHDPQAFGAMFSEDAQWVTASGLRVTGRADIQSVLGREHATWARATTMEAVDLTVRWLTQDMALVFFNWTIRSAGDTDAPATTFQGNALLAVASDDMGRTVVAGQVARHR